MKLVRQNWETILFALCTIGFAFAPMAVIRAAKAEEPVCLKGSDAYDIAVADNYEHGNEMWNQKVAENLCGMVPYDTHIIVLLPHTEKVWVAEVLVGGFGGAKAYQVYDELPTYIIPVVWKPEYAQNSPEVQKWYGEQELNSATKERLHVDWHSCCSHGDVFRTQFRVGDGPHGADEWWYLKDGKWRQIPDDVVKWGEHAPDKRPTLFIYQSTGQELCFYPGEDGN
jgi:hypothetical protein